MFGITFNYPVIGLTFSRNKVFAATGRKKVWKKTAEYIQSFPQECKEVTGTESHSWKPLCSCLESVIDDIGGGKNATLKIALPSPLVTMVIIRVDERPKNKTEAEIMIGRRIANLTGSSGKNCQIQSQYLVGEMNSHRLLGIAVEESLCASIETVEHKTNSVLTYMDSSASVRWNTLPGSVRSKAGVLVDIYDDYWLLLVWDDGNVPIFTKSKWRNTKTTQSDEPMSVCSEIYRTLVAWSEEEDGLVIEQFYLDASTIERSGFSIALETVTGIRPAALPDEGEGNSYVETSLDEMLVRKLVCAQ